MYACSTRVSAVILSVISSAGVEVLDGDKTYRSDGMTFDIVKHLRYAKLKMMGVMGMFDPTTPGKVYIFDHVTEEMIDYVLLHELGHLLSFRAKLGFHSLAEKLGLHTEKPVPMGSVRFEDLIQLKRLQFEEECIADCFAMGMLMRLGLSYEIELLHSRMNQYVDRLGNERIEELNRMAFSLANNMNYGRNVA